MRYEVRVLMLSPTTGDSVEYQHGYTAAVLEAKKIVQDADSTIRVLLNMLYELSGNISPESLEILEKVRDGKSFGYTYNKITELD